MKVKRETDGKHLSQLLTHSSYETNCTKQDAYHLTSEAASFLI